ncbi:hypothetical protein BB560_003545 [Smittium megazygosporum]|uniref:BHLH domain-containing protein n=1 Tax=Smittium megazygosporum TaxID=133381 RepID=A0A2T9ZBR7_9FUNG|nr:hypothetical protein BB560_003545 [Smittium megazygosporum]
MSIKQQSLIFKSLSESGIVQIHSPRSPNSPGSNKSLSSLSQTSINSAKPSHETLETTLNNGNNGHIQTSLLSLNNSDGPGSVDLEGQSADNMQTVNKSDIFAEFSSSLGLDANVRHLNEPANSTARKQNAEGGLTNPSLERKISELNNPNFSHSHNGLFNYPSNGIQDSERSSRLTAVPVPISFAQPQDTSFIDFGNIANNNINHNVVHQNTNPFTLNGFLSVTTPASASSTNKGEKLKSDVPQFNPSDAFQKKNQRPESLIRDKFNSLNTEFPGNVLKYDYMMQSAKFQTNKPEIPLMRPSFSANILPTCGEIDPVNKPTSNIRQGMGFDMNIDHNVNMDINLNMGMDFGMGIDLGVPTGIGMNMDNGYNPDLDFSQLLFLTQQQGNILPNNTNLYSNPNQEFTKSNTAANIPSSLDIFREHLQDKKLFENPSKMISGYKSNSMFLMADPTQFLLDPPNIINNNRISNSNKGSLKVGQDMDLPNKSYVNSGDWSLNNNAVLDSAIPNIIASKEQGSNQKRKSRPFSVDLDLTKSPRSNFRTYLISKNKSKSPAKSNEDNTQQSSGNDICNLNDPNFRFNFDMNMMAGMQKINSSSKVKKDGNSNTKIGKNLAENGTPIVGNEFEGNENMGPHRIDRQLAVTIKKPIMFLRPPDLKSKLRSKGKNKLKNKQDQELKKVFENKSSQGSTNNIFNKENDIARQSATENQVQKSLFSADLQNKDSLKAELKKSQLPNPQWQRMSEQRRRDAMRENFELLKRMLPVDYMTSDDGRELARPVLLARFLRWVDDTLLELENVKGENKRLKLSNETLALKINSGLEEKNP